MTLTYPTTQAPKPTVANGVVAGGCGCLKLKLLKNLSGLPFYEVEQNIKGPLKNRGGTHVLHICGIRAEFQIPNYPHPAIWASGNIYLPKCA